MSKVKIKVSFKNQTTSYEEVYTAIYQENDGIIVYKESNDITMKYDFKNNILIRTTPQMIIKYEFTKNKGICNISMKDINKELNILVKINKLINKTNNIEIEYEIENEIIWYKLEVLN